jgi:hypothetical protein
MQSEPINDPSFKQWKGCAFFLGIGLIAAYLLHSAVWVVIGPVAVFGVLLGIAALPFSRKITPQEFADELERRRHGR